MARTRALQARAMHAIGCKFHQHSRAQTRVHSPLPPLAAGPLAAVRLLPSHLLSTSITAPADATRAAQPTRKAVLPLGILGGLVSR